MRELRALVVIADPTGLEQYSPVGRQLRPVRVEDELAGAQAALACYRLVVLARRGETRGEASLAADPPRLTPVLGPGLADGILGSRQEMALRWVRRWHMPIAEHAQGDLAQVAQYLRVGRPPARVSMELQQYLRTDLRERRLNAQGADPFAALVGLEEDERPEKVIEAVGKVLRERDPDDPYRVVAALPVEVFVTTGFTDLLQDALTAQRMPNSGRCASACLCACWYPKRAALRGYRTDAADGRQQWPGTLPWATVAANAIPRD